MIEQNRQRQLVFKPPVQGGAGGYREMNVRKPLIICKTAHAITIVTDGCAHLPKFPVEGSRPNLKKFERISRALPSAIDGAYSRDWLRTRKVGATSISFSGDSVRRLI